MKLLLAAIGLAVGVGLTFLIRDDPGYVLISHGTTSIEMSLALFIVLVIALTALVILTFKIVFGLIKSPFTIMKWTDRRKERSANRAMSKAMLAQIQGEWRNAEKTLVSQAKKSVSPMLNYVGAAKAAQAQGAKDRREKYLKLAQEHSTAKDVAVDVARAEIFFENGQIEQALAMLLRAKQKNPKNGYVLLLLAKVYLQLKDWDQLSCLIPDLKRRKLLVGSEFDGLEKTMYQELMKSSENSLALKNTWVRIPKLMQVDQDIVLTFVEQASEKGVSRLAEPLVQESLKRRWNDDLAYAYGMLESAEPENQLAYAESLYKSHSDKPALLLTLGRLSLKEKQLDKARKYLDDSLREGAGPEAYRMLAHLSEQMGEPDAAAAYYRKGLEMLSQQQAQDSGDEMREPIVIDSDFRHLTQLHDKEEAAKKEEVDMEMTLHRSPSSPTPNPV